jgi:hypothetical protein
MKRHVTFESWCERDYLERALVDVVENYLDDRAVRFPTTAKRRSSPESGLAA